MSTPTATRPSPVRPTSDHVLRLVQRNGTHATRTEEWKTSETYRIQLTFWSARAGLPTSIDDTRELSLQLKDICVEHKRRRLLRRKIERIDVETLENLNRKTNHERPFRTTGKERGARRRFPRPFRGMRSWFRSLRRL